MLECKLRVGAELLTVVRSEFAEHKPSPDVDAGGPGAVSKYGPERYAEHLLSETRDGILRPVAPVDPPILMEEIKGVL